MRCWKEVERVKDDVQDIKNKFLEMRSNALPLTTEISVVPLDV